jgi:hypothetical protein
MKCKISPNTAKIKEAMSWHFKKNPNFMAS